MKADLNTAHQALSASAFDSNLLGLYRVAQ